MINYIYDTEGKPLYVVVPYEEWQQSEEVKENRQEKKERLRQALKGLQTTNVFDAIQDPVAWQKRIRDEW